MGLRAEAVVVGAELLAGQAEANGPVLARGLLAVGVELARVTVVGDDDAEIEAALAEAVRRSGLVVVSGGLGPTEDDRTRYAVAKAAGDPLALREELLEGIRAPFLRLGREMPPSNRVQALLPGRAEAVPNPVGTAPGFALEIEGALVVALPGVPREFRYLLDRWLLPRLRQRVGTGAVVTRQIRVSGLGESAVGEAVADLMGPGRNPYVGTLASPGEVRILAVARGEGEPQARGLLDLVEGDVRRRLGAYVFGIDDDTHPRVALRAAAAAGWRVACAEGFTGGLLARWLWEAKEEAFRGGIVEPGDALRRRFGPAGDPARAIRAMAEEAARALGADAGLATASEGELLSRGEGRFWVGVWREGVWAVRSLPTAFGAEADAERCCQQACYELRQFVAGEAGRPSPSGSG